jgi:hypothetical protein
MNRRFFLAIALLIVLFFGLYKVVFLKNGLVVYENTIDGYQFTYPKSWNVKDITSKDNTEVKGSRIVLVSDKPINKNREALHLPSYGLLLYIKSPYTAREAQCTYVKGVLKPEGTISIQGEEFTRCLDLSVADGIYNVLIPKGNRLLVIQYSKDFPDIQMLEKVVSSLKFVD